MDDQSEQGVLQRVEKGRVADQAGLVETGCDLHGRVRAARKEIGNELMIGHSQKT